jgi:hypothetical protein
VLTADAEFPQRSVRAAALRSFDQIDVDKSVSMSRRNTGPKSNLQVFQR